MLDRMQPIGEAIGAEAVVAVPMSAIHEQGCPSSWPSSMILPISSNCWPTDRGGQRRGRRTHRRVLVDDPQTASAGSAEVSCGSRTSSSPPPGAWTHSRSWPPASTTRPARFIGSALHSALAEIYAGGVSWLLGADLAAAIAEGTSQMSEEEATNMDRLGMLDATTMVIERHRDGEWYATNAEVRFSEQRRGVMAWLAEPAPMGSLEFVSPDAYVAASAVTKDAVDMFDELLGFAAAQDNRPCDSSQLFQQIIGIDLREDFAATIGGEATFALDGPMLPVPSWKLIVEVYDPGTLIHTIERAVDLINLKLAAEDAPEVVFEASEGSGGTYYIHQP